MAGIGDVEPLRGRVGRHLAGVEQAGFMRLVGLGGERDRSLVELAPERPLQTKRTTQDPTCLRADYTTGYDLTLRSRESVVPELSQELLYDELVI